jgi:hypothetical protein
MHICLFNQPGENLVRDRKVCRRQSQPAIPQFDQAFLGERFDSMAEIYFVTPLDFMQIDSIELAQAKKQFLGKRLLWSNQLSLSNRESAVED